MTNRTDSQSRPDTETLILQAAEREFMEKGFAGARTTSIAEAAGVTHAMFHYYFRTKEKLFERIVGEKISMLKGLLMRSIADANLSLDEMIRNVIEQHLDFLKMNPYLPRFAVCEIFGNPERTSGVIQEIRSCVPAISMLQKKIDDEAAKGLCRRVDARMLALDIASLNLFPFMSFPLVSTVLGDCAPDVETLVELRKKENYETIMRKLRP